MEATIIEAVKQGDIESVHRLVSGSEHVNQQDQHGWTALHWAAGRGDAQAVQFLLDNGADLALAGKDGRTPLMVAKAASCREVARILTGAEQSRGHWSDPAAEQLYCRAYEIGDLRRYTEWSEHQGAVKDARQDGLSSNDVVYLHQDFTVTRSMWPNQEVLFSNVTPEWKAFCQAALKFSVPEDLL